MKPIEELMTADEVAEYLRVNRNEDLSIAQTQGAAELQRWHGFQVAPRGCRRVDHQKRTNCMDGWWRNTLNTW
jgi:hypothetical protein